MEKAVAMKKANRSSPFYLVQVPLRKCGGYLSLCCGYGYRLLQTEFQQCLARYLHLLAFRQDLDASASRRAYARADGRALPAASNRADDGAGYRATTNFLGGVRATALPFQAVVAADDRIVLAIDHDAAQFKPQLTAAGHVTRFFSPGQPAVDIRTLPCNHGDADGGGCVDAVAGDGADLPL